MKNAKCQNTEFTNYKHKTSLHKSQCHVWASALWDISNDYAQHVFMQKKKTKKKNNKQKNKKQYKTKQNNPPPKKNNKKKKKKKTQKKQTKTN